MNDQGEYDCIIKPIKEIKQLLFLNEVLLFVKSEETINHYFFSMNHIILTQNYQFLINQIVFNLEKLNILTNCSCYKNSQNLYIVQDCQIEMNKKKNQENLGLILNNSQVRYIMKDRQLGKVINQIISGNSQNFHFSLYNFFYLRATYTVKLLPRLRHK
ncbi:unnamed protein product [Paramecium sonneborni]|uniref:Uncharacterized protein n=1 Tax=Paramecium sonneborni TaxID=65129 RepID=A0A8S1NMI3_9CILI|nr:unnamed protein product [Paramecium sonneborni]